MPKLEDVVEIKPFDCLEALGLTGNSVTGEMIIENFFRLFNDPDCQTPKRDLFKARDILLKSEVERQMGASEKRFFRIRAKIKNICFSCSGTGKKFLFEKERVVEPCHTCNASSKVIIACKACRGDGRHHHDLSEGAELEPNAEVTTDVACKVCGDTGKIMMICETCGGSKKVEKMMFKPIVKSADRCKACGGYGWNDPSRPKPKQNFKYKKFSNPVLSPENIAEQIKGKPSKKAKRK
jgi:hypothetical protein